MSGQRQEPRSRRALIARPVALFVLDLGDRVRARAAAARQARVPGVAAGTKIAVGDSYRGAIAFDQKCGGCHGIGGKGGSVGPRLIGDRISLAAVKQQIDAGGGAMPPALVKGASERDILAFVATIIKQPAATK